MVRPARLDWDDGNLVKCRKHGVSIEEIDYLFASDPFTTPDEAHSVEEDRIIAIGPTPAGRIIFVVFTVRMLDGEEIVRPISARYMHKKEIGRYEFLWGAKGAPTHH